MSVQNEQTVLVYRNGGSASYIKDGLNDPEIEKWERLFKYIDRLLKGDKSKVIVEFCGGRGEIASMLQKAGYTVITSDVDDEFLEHQKESGVNNVKKFNILKDNFTETFDVTPDLILCWRNPHLDKDDVRKVFKVAHDALANDGLFVINLQNLDVHRDEAEVLPNGTHCNFKVLEDRPEMPARFFAYYTYDDIIDDFINGLFTIEEYHTEGGSEKKNWHVGAYVKVKK